MSIADDYGWVDTFLSRHRARFKPHDWPGENEDTYLDYLADWIDAFRGPGVTEGEADRASRRLSLKPPQWKRDHLPAVVNTIATMRAERAPAAESAVTDCDAAKALSKGCEHCGGCGMTSVYHPRPDPERRVPASVGAHCVCPHGRWIRGRIAQQEPDLLRRIPDFAAALSGRSGWLVDVSRPAPPRPPVVPQPAAPRWPQGDPILDRELSSRPAAPPF